MARGEDVCGSISARTSVLDWDRLLARFGAHRRVLLSHRLLVGFAYPDGDRISRAVLHNLRLRAAADHDSPPSGMTARELARWTAAFESG